VSVHISQTNGVILEFEDSPFSKLFVLGFVYGLFFGVKLKILMSLSSSSERLMTSEIGRFPDKRDDSMTSEIGRFPNKRNDLKSITSAGAMFLFFLALVFGAIGLALGFQMLLGL